MSHRVSALEARLKALNGLIEAVSQEKITEELIGMIHRPGWTTVAEAALVQAMTEVLHTQLQAFQGGLRNLGSSAGLIGPTGPRPSGPGGGGGGSGSGPAAWSLVASMPNSHTGLGAATTAVFPPPPLTPGGFVDGTIIVITARLYVVGGSGQSNDVESYLPATNAWTAMANLPTARFNLCVATGSDHRIYAIGGRTNPAGSLSNAVEAYEPFALGFKLVPGEWSGGLAAMPTSRERAGATTGKDGRIYVIGGSNNPTLSFSSPLKKLEIYDPKSDSWSSGANMEVARDGVAAATGADGTIYAVGGFDGAQSVNSAESYNPATDKWTALPAMTSKRTDLAAAAGPDGRIYALGGADGATVFASTEIYDPIAGNWSAGPTMNSARSQFAAAIGPDGRLYAIGGSDGVLLLNSAEALTL
jgi:N-acetylneuraminic acid mutarotase